MRKFDVVYFAASCDDPETNKKFAESLDLDFPILSDPDGKVARAYGIYVESRKFPQRVTFFIDKDGKIAAIEKKVNVRKHGDDVANKLKELGFKTLQ